MKKVMNGFFWICCVIMVLCMAAGFNKKGTAVQTPPRSECDTCVTVDMNGKSLK